MSIRKINKESFKSIKVKKYIKFFLIKYIRTKIYFSIHSDVQFKKFYKIIKFIFGININIKFVKFNLLKIDFIVLDKYKKGYVRVIKYINLFNILSLYIKK